MQDYARTLDRLQRGLGRAWREDPMILGVPGVSLAVKIDPFHYLAVHPAFLERLGRWAAVVPRAAREALLRGGDLLVGPGGRGHVLAVSAVWGSPPRARRLRACFVLAGFVDRALLLYGGERSPLPVADLRLLGRERPAVDAFLQHKTRIDKTAFTPQD
jgi:hypothetical protein